MDVPQEFDVILTSKKPLSTPLVQNVAELLFQPLPHRSEDAVLIMSHEQDRYIEISLEKMRYIISSLYQAFQEKNIQPGDTVLLVTLSVNTEVYTIVLFTALVSYGARVLFPMFVETAALDTWMKQTRCTAVIVPEKEIQLLRGHEKQKKVIQNIKTVAATNHLLLFDITDDFHLKKYFEITAAPHASSLTSLVQKSMHDTGLSTESVIFTTSGSSGKSKLVLYEQGAFLRCCQSWQESGMYDKERLGGRSFLDILPHTISIRALFNAYWTGYPLCIVNTDWVKQKPQKILPLLVKMKPQIMTLGPASFSVLLELLRLVPEIRELAFSELRTVVSTGAPYSKKIAEEIQQHFGLFLHNAYGTSETQQVLTTVLCDQEERLHFDLHLGKPLNGVTLGLQKFQETLYRLFIKSPFGHKAIIEESIREADDFFATGDIVELRKNNILIYVGREQKDFLKSGYGAKVPLSYLTEYYKDLYRQVNHIEFYAFETFTFSFGIAALIFITDERLPPGRVTDKKTMQRLYKTIKNSNKSLLRTLEPFEYEQRIITRFLLINHDVAYTAKGTISGFSIETHFEKEIFDLLHSQEKKSGVRNIIYLHSFFIYLLVRYTPFRLPKIRKMVLNFFLNH
jgi:acyl-coenzyme A synthetase/AMP-(fatty) acid ligase